MKLWYHSMSHRTEWGGHPRVLRGILDKVREPAETAATTFDCQCSGDFGQ
jgi:hypothetical protein